MTKDEALKLALEKFEFMNHVDSIFADEFDFQINAIKEALAQPEQEPVAYLCENAVGHKYFRWKKPSSAYKPIALYTSTPQRKPLTDEEIQTIAKEHIAVGTRSFEEFVRRIEAAHNIKGEA